MLKDAGVRRARVTPDTVEVEFEGAEPEVVVETTAPSDPDRAPVRSVSQPKQGYAALFEKFPGFAKTPAARE